MLCKVWKNHFFDGNSACEEEGTSEENESCGFSEREHVDYELVKISKGRYQIGREKRLELMPPAGSYIVSV